MKHFTRYSVVLAALLGAGIGPALSVAAPGPQTSLRESGEETGYALGPDDQITIRVHDAEEFNDRAYRIAPNGYVTLPMIGRVKAAGLSLTELERELTSELKKYIRQPEVSVTVTEFRSQPVTVIGAVKSPGILQLQGSRTLVEILSMAGGLQPDAGHSVMIMRRKEWGALPLPGVQMDAAGEVSTAEVRLEDVLEARGPEHNIVVRPNDIVSVPRAEIIYVLGAVKRSGGFVLNQRDSLSVLQVLSMAEGLERTAAPQKSKILRINPNTNQREEIPFDLAKIFSGKAPDVALRPDDILFVPDSAPKKAAFRTLDALVNVGTSVVTGLAIYR